MLHRSFVCVLSCALSLASLAAQEPEDSAKEVAAPQKDATNAAPAEMTKRHVKLVALRGAFADLPEQSFDLAAVLGGGSKPKAFYEMIDRLEELAADTTSDTVLFDLSQPFMMNLPQASEMRRTLQKLRQAKKKCIAYLENAARAQYAIAAQCDQILMADMGSLDIGSLSLSTTYMKDAFDLFGIQTDVLRCGDFKGAAEPYMLSDISPHLRRHYMEMLGRMNDEVVTGIAKGRGLSTEKVRELQAKRLIPAKEALMEGLVDRLVPWRGAEVTLREILGGEPIELDNALRAERKRDFNLLAFMQNMFKPSRDVEVDEDTLVVVHLSGAIVDGPTPMPGSIVSGPTVDLIRKIADNDSVRGVVVRINSPGGSATASEAIVLALADLAKKKPVVCSMGSLAASGGYYITCFGRPILAEAGTITGSIGVLGVKMSFGPLMRRIGVREALIALDEGAGLTAIDRGWSEQDKERLQALMNDVYGRFLDHVASSRNMSRAEVEAIAGGRVWSGEQGVENGLVDRIGGLQDAIDMVAKEVGIEDYTVTHMPRPRTLFDAFADDLIDVRAVLSPVMSPALLRRLGSLGTTLVVLRDALGDHPTRVWALMPHELEVR
jgi:protease-4